MVENALKPSTLNTGAFMGQRGAVGTTTQPYQSWSKAADDLYDNEGNVVGSDDYYLIDKVYVPPEMRGKGVGRRLVIDALNEIKNENKQGLPVKLSAYPDKGPGALNLDDLVRWYEGMGFEAEPSYGHAVIMRHDGNIPVK